MAVVGDVIGVVLCKGFQPFFYKQISIFSIASRLQSTKAFAKENLLVFKIPQDSLLFFL